MADHIIRMIQDLVADRDLPRYELIEQLEDIQDLCGELIDALKDDEEDEMELFAEDNVIDDMLDEWEN